MKNKILIILIIFMAIIAAITYVIYNYRIEMQEAQKINNEYKSYYQAKMLGTELVSIMNKTEDTNTKNGVEKDSEGLYIDNGENSIKVYVKLIYKEDYSTLEIEKILNNGIENFMNSYSTADFECTEITYHEKTGNVKSLTFTETED